jgi:hypothetical protein
MIRRDINMADGAAGWALIPQVEHARISAQLAERCLGRFGAGANRSASDDAEDCASIRAEVLAAIRCHDDGWAEWEQCPRLDPELRRPLSFMELEPAEAITIWTRSIGSAERYGPLAGWMVAGHFLRLLRKWDAALREAFPRRWLDDTEQRRADWLAQWQQVDPEHRTPEIAEEALEWLWTFDEVSLWFCSSCPSREDLPAKRIPPYVAGAATPVELKLSAIIAADAREAAGGMATAIPYRFVGSPIDLIAPGRLVKAGRYRDCDELFAASELIALHWRLQP